MDFVRNPFYFFISNEISTTSQHAWSRCYLELAIHSPYMLITKKSYNHMIVKTSKHHYHHKGVWLPSASVNNLCSVMYSITSSQVRYFIDRHLLMQSLTLDELIWFGTISSTGMMLSLYSCSISLPAIKLPISFPSLCIHMTPKSLHIVLTCSGIQTPGVLNDSSKSEPHKSITFRLPERKFFLTTHWL